MLECDTSTTNSTCLAHGACRHLKPKYVFTIIKFNCEVVEANTPWHWVFVTSCIGIFLSYRNEPRLKSNPLFEVIWSWMQTNLFVYWIMLSLSEFLTMNRAWTLIHCSLHMDKLLNFLLQCRCGWLYAVELPVNRGWVVLGSMSTGYIQYPLRERW